MTVLCSEQPLLRVLDAGQGSVLPKIQGATGQKACICARQTLTADLGLQPTESQPVYIRIKDDEWNIYRRYTEFRGLHHKLQNKYPQVRAYNFPPKKAIGNKVTVFAVAELVPTPQEDGSGPTVQSISIHTSQPTCTASEPSGKSLAFPSLKCADAKFVEERRKQLQNYLRSVMNKVIQVVPEFAASPRKETLVQLVPFFM
ncbi:hypothetical protein CB1_001431019 [Camelus ferus]|nr:hypothetical protein CB1_001431019 [Camelus ferus]